MKWPSIKQQMHKSAKTHYRSVFSYCRAIVGEIRNIDDPRRHHDWWEISFLNMVHREGGLVQGWESVC